MVNLVAEYPSLGRRSTARPTQTKVPETLLNDLLLIQALNAHFHTDVTCAAILITVDQEVKVLMRDCIVCS